LHHNDSPGGMSRGKSTLLALDLRPGLDSLGASVRTGRATPTSLASATRRSPFCPREPVMSEAVSPDHDQRLKVLLKEFFEQFLLCFSPAWAARFEFGDIAWLDKEVFLAPPQGEKRQLDLLARLKLRPGVLPPRPGFDELVALVHIEVETRT